MMIDFLFYVLLGVVQGIAEWLPVSSEGMLTLVGLAFGYDFSQSIRIAIWIHLGTLIAAVIYYFEDWKRILLDIRNSVPERNFLIITTIGTAVTGIPIKIWVLDALDADIMSVLGYLVIGIALLVTSALIYFSRKTFETNLKEIKDLSFFEQFLIGIAQGFTIIPGISRSGTTVSALLLEKVDSEESFRGSFLMSVPAVLGGVVLDIIDISQSTSNVSYNIGGIIIGILLAFIFGILTIHTLINFARKINFATFTFIFGVILIIIGLVLIL